MATTAAKTLKKMLADKDPVAWLVAADMIEEEGGDGSALRRRASLAIAVRRAVIACHSALVARWYRGERTPGGETAPVEGVVELHVTGGGQVLSANLAIRGPAVVHWRDASAEGGWRADLVRERHAHTPVSKTVNLRRDLFARPDYLNRRAAELADELIEPTHSHHRRALEMLTEYHATAKVA